MPYLAVIIPQIPQDQKDKFLAAFSKIAEETKAHPSVLGVAGGQIVAMDGAKVDDFKFIQTIAFLTEEDAKSFKESELLKTQAAKYSAEVGGEPLHSLFHVADFPNDSAPPPLTQFSRMIVKDDSQAEKVKEAWTELMAQLGKEPWGGVSVGGDEKSGMGIVGWQGREEFEAAVKNDKTKALWTKYQALGECQDLLATMQKY